MEKFYYGVKSGRNPGIYDTWAECKNEVKGYKGAEYKKFKTYEEARDFVEDNEDKSEHFEDNSEDFLKRNMKDDEAVAYVDGSFSLELSSYSYGVVMFTKEGKETFSGKSNDLDFLKMRNVAGELRGAIEAMKYALSNGKRILYLHYDYKGIEEWAKGSWKTNKMGTQAYKEYYDSIKDVLEVVFVKVLAHSGVEYNEEADELAKKELF